MSAQFVLSLIAGSGSKAACSMSPRHPTPYEIGTSLNSMENTLNDAFETFPIKLRTWIILQLAAHHPLLRAAAGCQGIAPGGVEGRP
jgi:hypothetical protein